jgi:GTP-binding protein
VFFDEATIFVWAGDGGNGCVSFRREKFVPLGGPDGGSGGTGGSVYLRVNAALNTLVAFTRRRHFRAENGGPGLRKGMQGRNGQDLYIDVPPGTVVRDKATGATLGDLTTNGQALLVARGGRAGRGNEVFKSPTRQAPHFAEKGEPGQERILTLELRLIADVGLVGKPNVGKSTLLACVSAARPKIADYPFTTLSPVLGVVEVDGQSFVMADIPGLIAGAHAGAGLGLEFLRHVQRTRLLVHLLDGASAAPVADYQAINYELALHSSELAAKPQIVVLNKMDLPEAQERFGALQQELRGVAGDVYAISAATGRGVRELLRAIASRLADMPRQAPAPSPFVFRPHEHESTAFTVTQESPGVFRVSGEEIERLAVMTDWSNVEGMERFERMLQARGISEKLVEVGVRLGDTVIIGDIELEWR